VSIASIKLSLSCKGMSSTSSGQNRQEDKGLKIENLPSQVTGAVCETIYSGFGQIMPFVGPYAQGFVEYAPESMPHIWSGLTAVPLEGGYNKGLPHCFFPSFLPFLRSRHHEFISKTTLPGAFPY
jgi:hypothetical protein